MSNRKKFSLKHVFLSKLLGVNAEEIERKTNCIFIWSGVWFEIVTDRQMTAPHSHYIKNGKYRVRELGNQSKIRKDIEL